MAKSTTPQKPRPDFPLFPHRNGWWCKKVRQKLHYFGKVAEDPKGEKALDLWLEQRDDLLAGRTPHAASDDLVVSDLCNRFLTSKRNSMKAGELTARTWSDYYRICETLVEFFGKNQPVLALRPEDFDRFRADLSKRRGPVAIANAIVRTRVVFKWAFDNDLIDRPVRFGTVFKRPNKKVLRRAKREGGSRVFAATDVLKLLEGAGHPMKAMILLGLNCGFGQTDIATLPLSALDLDGGWATYPRPKTEVIRRCPLWPETVKAIREWLARRPEAKEPADKGLVFLTQRGARWIRQNVKKPKAGEPEQPEEARVIYWNDYIASEFDKLARSAGVKRRGGFYNLRHTFRTVSDRCKDQPAIDAIMGHTKGEMSEEYRDLEQLDDDRLRDVVNVVRTWLWPGPKLATPPVETGAA
jgi:integrase